MQIRWNINNSGQVLQTYLYKQVLKNFEPSLRFYQIGKKPARQRGYETLAWTKVRKMTYAPADVLLTEWVTPTEKAFSLDTISLTPNQYGMYVTLADMLLDVAPINLLREAWKVIWDNMARVVDQVIQDNLALNGTNVNYAWAAANRAALGAWDTLTTQDLAKWNAFLTTKAVPQMWGSYVAIAHPNVVYDLQMETGEKSRLDINKYTKWVGKIYEWEIGKLFNVRVITSAFVQTFTSTVTVYPTYIFGEWSFGVAELQKMNTYVSPRKSSDSDPLAQRAKVGAKCAFNTIILQQDAVLRLESASSLAYTRA